MRLALLVAVGLLGLPGAGLAAERFAFAGLSRTTTAPELEARFPTSSFRLGAGPSLSEALTLVPRRRP